MPNSLKHISTWCLYGVFVFGIFNFSIDLKTSVIRTLYIVLLQILIFYTNLKWLLPRFYELKRYLLYTLLNIALTAIAIGIGSFSERLTPHYMEHNDDFHLAEMKVIDLESIFMNTMPATLAIFVSFFLFTHLKRQRQEEKELAVLKAEKTFLVQQINPHFLFNTLNNIYFLTYKTAPRGSAAIMQLSKMLDYSLHGEKQEKVDLKNEIDYINNFIALFQLKDSSIEKIVFDYSEANTHLKIAPLLFIPFVENAFKHGDIEDEGKGYISIKLTTNHQELLFNCTNSFDPQKTVDQTHGIGIKNISRRLELLYPDKHEIKINRSENEFDVQLKIDLDA